MNYKGRVCYTESVEKAKPYKEMYLNSIRKFLDKNYASAKECRAGFVSPEKMAKNREFYVEEYRRLIGIPDISGENTIPHVKREFVAKDEMCEIFRLSIEVMSDFWFYGLLLFPLERVERAPLVICQHGGGGTPEHCCDMDGDNNYSNFSKIVLEQGCIVFAPQLLLWNFQPNCGEKFQDYGVVYDRSRMDAELKRFGFSMTGLEIFCIMRSIDYLVSLKDVDENRIGMMGLSYGGYFSLRAGAFDQRVKCIYDAASFNDRYRVFLNDWTWQKDADRLGEAEICGLCCPRRLILDVGKNDPVFDYAPSVREARRAKEYYDYHGAGENFYFNLWNGEHKFDVEHSMRLFFEGLMQ